MNCKNQFRTLCLTYLDKIRKHKIPKLEQGLSNESVFIEFRELPHSEVIIRNLILRTDSSWSHTIVCGKANQELMKKICTAISPNIKIIVFDIHDCNLNMYNNLLHDVRFWKTLSGNKVLIYQEDSFVFRNGINEFLKYDYIGAYWPHHKNSPGQAFQGNGGFSIRNRELMIKILESFDSESIKIPNSSHETQKLPEDLFFSKIMYDNKIGILPSADIACKFSSECRFTADSCAGHAFWISDPNWVRRIQNSINNIEINNPSKVVLSFTTSPTRINKCHLMLESILNQTRKPDLILLNIPDIFSRTNETYVIPQILEKYVTINRCKLDYGPGTKIIPTVKYLQDHNFPSDTLIIYCDDDILYLPSMVQSYQNYNDYNVHCIGGFNFLDYNICGERRHLENANIAEGYGAVGVRFGIFQADFEDYIEKVTSDYDIRLSDDVYLSNYYSKHGVKIKIHCQQYSIFELWKRKCILEYGNESDALHLGANNTSVSNVERYKTVLHKLNEMKELYILPFFTYGNIIKQQLLNTHYNINRRVEYYLNKDFKKKNPIMTLINNSNKNINCDECNCVNGDIIMKEMKKTTKLPNFNAYGKEMMSYLLSMNKYCNKDYTKKAFLWRWGDCTEIPQYNIISKARSREDTLTTILNLNSVRHWGYVMKVPQYDIPFEDKLNATVWRGAVNESSVERYNFVERYENTKNMNIGFSYIPYSGLNIDLKYVKGSLTISEQLKYKYIISIEGNDVASGLKWQLYSNSIVLMKRPTKVSWAMEDTLIPYKHYVPLSDNYDNVIEQIHWCEQHQDECKMIANNATEFINQFLNNEIELLISVNMLKKYFD